MTNKPAPLEEGRESRPAAANPISPQDLAALERLRDTLLELRHDFERLLARLRQEQDSPAHGLIVSRLECVVVDRLTPALADLSSIAEAAHDGFEIEAGEPDLDAGSRTLDAGSRSAK